MELKFFGVISIEAEICLLFPLKPIDPTKLNKDDGRVKSGEPDINNSTKCLVWYFLGRVVNNDDDIDDDCLTIISLINKVEYLV